MSTEEARYNSFGALSGGVFLTLGWLSANYKDFWDYAPWMGIALAFVILFFAAADRRRQVRFEAEKREAEEERERAAQHKRDRATRPARMPREQTQDEQERAIFNAARKERESRVRFH